MGLGKMLRLGGMENSSPRADQTTGRFRVARNVYPTPDNRIIPRYDFSEDFFTPVASKKIHYLTSYNKETISLLTATGPNDLEFYSGSTRIPRHNKIAISPFDTGATDFSQPVNHFRKNQTQFFLIPSFFGSVLCKYDGVEISTCGTPQPAISSADRNSAGAKFVRVVRHRVDFDNNEPTSEYVQYRTNASPSTILTGLPIINMIGNDEVRPRNVINEGGATYFGRRPNDTPYFIGTATYVPLSDDFSITTANTNITDSSMVGTYVFIRVVKGSTAPGLGNFLSIALKVKSILPLVLDANGAKCLSQSREWIDLPFSVGGVTLASEITFGTREIMSAWASISADGIYFLRNIAPTFPYSDVSISYTVNLVSTTTALITTPQDYMITVGPILNDTFSVITRKLSPNANYPFGSKSNVFTSISQFQDLLMLSTDDLVWFSDTSLGGSIEQLTTASFIRVGDTEFGRVVAIGGTQDFLFVSRERKNYYLSGTIDTGNYKVQELSDIETGAWSGNSIVGLRDSLIFINSTGVYRVTSGGRTESLGSKISKCFSTFDLFPINEDVVFRMTDLGSNAFNSYEYFPFPIGQPIQLAYDEYRELLFFLSPNSPGSATLVLHVKTAEFYEWDGLFFGAGESASAIMANLGKIYISKYVPMTSSAVVFSEDQMASKNYTTNYPVKLYSTWMTAGEPSIEKQLLQIKMFGVIDSSESDPLTVVHFKDWDYGTKITQDSYIYSGSMFSHKKRLTSDKLLAASVGVEISSPDASFQLESMEVEFNPIQAGVKR